MASMIAPIASYWVSVERRRLVQVIPEPVRKIWDRWDVRGPVITSFVAQGYLTVTGNWRKAKVLAVFEFYVWILYFVSDWVVNFALDMISSKVGDYVDASKKPADDPDPELMAFWGTIMLVHLGGPHSITAYALEDNALWPRNLVLSLVQSTRVLYIVLLAWGRSSTWLSCISIAMLVVGCIKCGERTWALYSASIDRRRDMLIPPSLDSPDEEKEISSHVVDTSVRVNADGDDHVHEQHSHSATKNHPGELLQNFMRLFVSLFADLVISDEDLRKGQSNFRGLEPNFAFKQVQDELGYAYDIFYTKAFVRSSYWGRVLQLITISITVIVFICFQIMVIPSYRLSEKDKKITYALLVGPLVIEIRAILNESGFSTWTANWLKGKGGDRCRSFPEETANMFLCTDLLTLCLESDSYQIFAPETTIAVAMYLRPWEVTQNLKSQIFNHMVKYSFNEEIDVNVPVSIKWTKQLDFHQSIITWHIATNICYHCDDHDNSEENNLKKICKNLSDYMLYLLVFRRFMLPVGTGLVVYRDTFDETKEFLRREKKRIPRARLFQNQLTRGMRAMYPWVSRAPKVKPRHDHTDNFGLQREICNKLLQPEDGVRRRKAKSALLDGCRLARSLREMERTEVPWEFLANVWVEILGYAAVNCRVDHHAQQLRKGGEFLTHVWLLMAHLGLMEQFQVTAENPAQPQSNDP